MTDPNQEPMVSQPTYAQVHELNLNDTSSPMPDNSGMKGTGNMKHMNKLFLLLIGAVVLAGVGTGTGLQQLTAKTTSKDLYHGQKLEAVPTATVQKGQIFGSPDESTFKDSAEGVLQLGGIDGEGSHKLLRPGGASQTVYLTSSVTDLNKFENMKVKVWGETFKGQKAGWLMDVGRIQVEETQAEVPTE